MPIRVHPRASRLFSFRFAIYGARPARWPRKQRDLQANHNRRGIDVIYREITKRDNSSAHARLSATRSPFPLPLYC